jgi:hypothetical protein
MHDIISLPHGIFCYLVSPLYHEFQIVAVALCKVAYDVRPTTLVLVPLELYPSTLTL